MRDLQGPFRRRQRSPGSVIAPGPAIDGLAPTGRTSGATASSPSCPSTAIVPYSAFSSATGAGPSDFCLAAITTGISASGGPVRTQDDGPAGAAAGSARLRAASIPTAQPAVVPARADHDPFPIPATLSSAGHAASADDSLSARQQRDDPPGQRSDRPIPGLRPAKSAQGRYPASGRVPGFLPAACAAGVPTITGPTAAGTSGTITAAAIPATLSATIPAFAGTDPNAPGAFTTAATAEVPTRSSGRPGNAAAWTLGQPAPA